MTRTRQRSYDVTKRNLHRNPLALPRNVRRTYAQSAIIDDEYPQPRGSQYLLFSLALILFGSQVVFQLADLIKNLLQHF